MIGEPPTVKIGIVDVSTKLTLVTVPLEVIFVTTPDEFSIYKLSSVLAYSANCPVEGGVGFVPFSFKSICSY